MSSSEIAEKLEDFSDEELASVIDFIETTGSIEEARAAIEALSRLREAA